MLSLVLLLYASLMQAKEGATAGCPRVKVEVERLPDLHIARAGHNTVYAGDVPMVVGGHTHGFKPTATAEYYSDGEWHVVDMVYNHDHALALPLSSGSVLIAGGHQQDLGIGQIHSVERYDPVTHTFDGFGCLDTKRVYANATEIDSGHVVISGNWYHVDNIEVFDGDNSFVYIKEVAQPRAMPYIFRTARDNVAIFSAIGPKVDTVYDTIVVDQLHGEPFTPPLFRQWRPLHIRLPFYSRQCFIGDEASGDYSYLFPVIDSEEQLAIALMRSTDGQPQPSFSLLPTDYAVPADFATCTVLVADRERQKAYLVGTSTNDSIVYSHLYVLTIDYAESAASGFQKPARLTLRYTDQLDGVGCSTPHLAPNGDLLLAGGKTDKTNFKPLTAAIIFHVGIPISSTEACVRTGRWLWVAAIMLLIALCAGLVFAKRRRQTGHDEVPPETAEEPIAPTPQPDTQESPTDTQEPPTAPQESSTDSQLMERICQLMDEQQPYLNAELKVTDVAELLGSNRTYISACINSQRGCTFSQFVNGYRVDYAKQLLAQSPGIKLSEVWTASGFSSESSFFRAFKSFTGTTPMEWIARNSSPQE